MYSLNKVHQIKTNEDDSPVEMDIPTSTKHDGVHSERSIETIEEGERAPTPTDYSQTPTKVEDQMVQTEPMVTETLPTNEQPPSQEQVNPESNLRRTSRPRNYTYKYKVWKGIPTEDDAGTETV